ncbi:MAG: DegV family protein [Coriobacteriia bacterium]|nr:DegV family protein [Coriobacteriia bacterium]
MAVRIVTDSASSLSEADSQRLSITTVPLHVVVEGHDATEEQLREPAFYTRLATMADLPKTSQPSPDEFSEIFRRFAEEGDDVLVIAISAAMSGTVDSARVAADVVRAEYPGARIEVLDSRSNSLEEGFAVLSAAEAALAGASFDECVQAAEETMRRTRFLFAPHSLEYLRRGGRISGAAGLLGVMLRIAPILTAANGATGVAGMARSTRSAWVKMATLMRKDVERYGLRWATVQYIADREEAVRFASQAVASLVGGDVPIVPIPPVVGLHVGPAVGVVYETERPMR